MFFEPEIGIWFKFEIAENNQVARDKTDSFAFLVSVATSPQGPAFRWNTGSRQSQKQRKRSKSNTSAECADQHKSSEGNSNDTADSGKEEWRPTAW